MKHRQSIAKHQRGITTLGLIILVAFLGLFVYAILRLVPVYLEDAKISGAFESLENEFIGTDFTRRDLVNGLEKRFDVESVNIVNFRDVEVTKINGGFELSLIYTNKQPYMANVSFAVDFRHKATIVR